MENTILERGIAILYKELGPNKTIKFFQNLGVNSGDSVKEIESITEKMSKEEVIELMRKTNKR